MKNNEDESFSLKAALKDMAENTTLHGVPKIVSAKRVNMKILWAILFIGLSGYLSYSLYQLFERYYSWPIQTTVSLEFKNLKFPAVSFCNVNPIKKSKVGDASQQLRDLLRIRDEMDSDWEVFPENNTQIDSASDSGNATDPLSQPTGNGDSTNHSATDWSYWDMDYDDEPPIDYSAYDLDLDSTIASLLALRKDEWFQRVQDFKAVFLNESKAVRKRIGHSIDDMLLSCSFEGRKCDIDRFYPFQSTEYGNCYSLEHDFTSVRSGPTYGLWLTLNLEVPEYIKNYASGYGIKLVIHEPDTYAFPSDEGLIISPGQETLIGLRMVQIQRIQTPNKYCEKGGYFKRQYGIKFTMTACVQLCKQTLILERCGCMPSSGIEVEMKLNVSNMKSVMVCDPHSFEQTLCQMKIDQEHNKRTLSCDCNSPCNEIVYQKTISGRNWPNDDYLKYGLLRELCRHNINLTYMESICAAYEADKDKFSTTEIKDNFIRLVIFYEDLNYETIKEEPMYDSFRFISDVGGTMGLFIGASLLSFFELVQLFVVLCTYVRERLSSKNKVTKIKTLKSGM